MSTSWPRSRQLATWSRSHEATVYERQFVGPRHHHVKLTDKLDLANDEAKHDK